MPSADPCLQQVHAVLPRLLALFDRDRLGPTYGQGDRMHWAWKLKDFGNGTFQGAAHGLARLLAGGLLPAGYSDALVLGRIGAMFDGARALTRRNGSLEEAFPYESSFCVTALVAHDLLSAIELLGERLHPGQRAHCLGVVRPMIGFLHRAEETHAFISNHLATAAAALYRWSALTGEPGETRGAELLRRILHEASAEGWLREYQGADPGYQSLCLQYLADLHRARPDLGLREYLERAFRFLWHFAHPDGSFGGLYGSRNTRFYYPAAALLVDGIPEAAALALRMRRSIAELRTVTLASMDDANLIPMFNSYCWAAALEEKYAHGTARQQLPCDSDGAWRRVFPGAGLLVDRGKSHYTIVSWHKGGVCCHFPSGGSPVTDPGVAARAADGRIYSTQGYDAGNGVHIENDRIEIRARFSEMRRQLPCPWKFIVLRALNVSVMRFTPFRERIKQALVRLLITGGRTLSGHNRRVIAFGERISISDESEDIPAGLSRIEPANVFSAIHMASQGYWQAQDDSE